MALRLKDLRTTYNTLTELDHPVPKELLVYLAEKIRETETRKMERRMSRMTEEELIAFEHHQRHTLRVTLPDGRIIQKKTSEATFRCAMAELEVERLQSLPLIIGRKRVVEYDASMKRQRIKGYAFLRPGFFVIAKSTIEEKVRILKEIDEALRLNWDIE